MSGKSRIATIVAFCAVLIPGSIVSAATLSGRAYEGSVGDESHELPGVTVSLYGAPEAGGPRTHIVTQTTASNGWYGLPVAEGFEHYYIVAESGPDPTYTFEGATSVGGTASGNQIHYSTLSAPLDDQTLTGNKFWYKKEGQEPPENNPPVADAGGPYSTLVGMPLLLDGSGSYDPDAGDSITKYEWYQSYLPISGAHITPTYVWVPPGAGQFTLQLEVTDSHGESDTDTATVTVEEVGEPWTVCQGIKWNDLNGNQLYDPGEPNLPGWTIYLDTNLNGRLDEGEPSDTTDEQGNFDIRVQWGPPSRTITLSVREVMQAGWEQTSPDTVPTVSFGSSQMQTISVNFGNRLTDTPPPGGEGTIRGTKFNDVDGNGQRDIGELGLPDWQIVLQDTDGNVLATATTDANGDYAFTGLEPGPYEVDEVQQSGWRQTYPEIDGAPAVWVIGLEPEAVVDEIDFGNHEDGGPGGTGEIHGRKWNDRDGQGDPDEDEEGLGGWRIFAELEEVADGQWEPGEPFAITDDLGYYIITELSEGMYRVSEEGQGGWEPTFPPEKHYSGVMLSQGQVLLDLDFGNHRTDEPGGEYDFGDAAGYPTLLLNNGARHVVDEDLFLGYTIDSEPDGLPTPNADGDDNTGNNDEDGVLMSPVIAAGTPVNIRIIASSSGVLNAWLDFNINGTWADAGEHIIAAQPVSAGATSFTINVPANARLGQTYARFRLSSVRDLSYDGLAPDGEVEDYLVEIKAEGPGLPPGGIISGYKWNDLNGNGQRDTLGGSPEPPLAGWTIWLDSNHNGRFDKRDLSEETDDRGYFQFTGLAAGTYMVGEEPQPGWTQTFPSARGPYTVSVSVNEQSPREFEVTAGQGTVGDSPYLAMGSSGTDTLTAFDVDYVGVNTALDVYVYNGDAAVQGPSNVYDSLDGTWDHDNGSDQWDGTGPGWGGAGGAIALEEDGVTFLRIQDTGDPTSLGLSDPSNSRIYFTHRFEGHLDGARLTFRTRIATTPPLDDRHDGGTVAPWPVDGIAYDIRDGGKGMVGIGDPEVGVLSFSLARREQVAGLAGFEDVTGDILVMNSLVGAEATGDVDTDDKAEGMVARNWLAVDDVTEWNSVVVDITAAGAGTHTVRIEADQTFFPSITFGNRRTGAPGPDDERDYGDAPDKYRTYRNSGGPYHDIGNVTLGSLVDSEGDGQPTNAADGDDAGVSDEDGVFPSFSWYSGGSGSVTIDLTGPAGQLATVAGWVDFNRNGNWDSGEQVVSGVYACTGGVQSLPFTFNVPSVGSGPVYARFRVYRGETVAVSPYGYGGVGEVEDYRFYVLSDAPGPDDELDYGDAPASYGVASHDVGYYRLGQQIDTENGQLFSPNADGDDLDYMDDEDGVVLLSDLVIGQTAGIEVRITNIPHNMPLSAFQIDDCHPAIWIDFDQDGVFQDPAERIPASADSYVVTPQCINVSRFFQVPTTAVLGTTFMRVRSHLGSLPYGACPLSPTGYGGQGEVEDYQVEIKLEGDVPPVGHLITGIKFNDLDGDGAWEPGQGEPGLPGWTIWLDTNNDGTPDQTTTTNATGHFDFYGLPPGKYTIGEQQQAGWVQTLPGAPGSYTPTVPGGPMPTITFMMFGNTQIDHPTGEVDFGDAPSTYGNAWHTIGDLTMGPTIDAEVFAQHSPAADGDDTHDTDDEDGVAFSKPLKRGAQVEACIDIYNPTPFPVDVIVAGWVDFGGDGTWNLVPDTIGARNVNLPPHSIVRECIVFTVPQNAKPGDTIARFRFFEDTAPPGVSLFALPTGGGGDGEVEDHPVEILSDGPGPGDEGYDYGDAPDPTYPTLLASNGARHRIDPDIYLGYGVESDPDGQPDFGAQGDDNDGSDDEDGVNFLSPCVQGTAVGVEVIASVPGVLNAWIDFNGDGDWGDADDHVFIDQPVGAGSNVLPVNIPATAQAGTTFARFRFSTQGGLSYEGEANDGEVEDYPVEIEVLTSAIGGFVWNDKNSSRGRDAGEPGIGGVTLDLLDLNGNVLFTTVTTGNGRYDFSNLPAGAYMVDVTDTGSVLSGYVLTTANDPASVTLAPGQMLNVHFGYHQQIATMDFGDAPDPSYPTLLDSDGARHVVVMRTYLGSSVDAELNGKPDPGAQGDDNADTDDEDGISGLPSKLIPGDKPTVTVKASVNGYLNAWIDFNRDGDWSDPGEQIFTNEAISFGVSSLSFSVPTSAEPGPTLARFRYNTTGGLSFDGLADDGEVEDYLVEIGDLRWDFGDAPDSYSTTLARDGARHPIVTGVYMGSGVDAEIDGQDSADAQGDDSNGSDDEDGANFKWPILPGGLSGIEVTVSTDGVLHGNIDFNRDGDFDDYPEDYIFFDGFSVDGVASAGVNTWVFNVPSSAVPGPTFARLRFSTRFDTQFFSAYYDGEAEDGEVEDYVVEIEDPGDMDFGDAPDSYHTLMANDGARHMVVPGIYLGSGVDVDVDGQPDPTAMGDDMDGNDDDDGVTFKTALIKGNTAHINVTASMKGYLYAWVDFNIDGDWDEQGEQIYNAKILSAGSNSLMFDVPSSANAGHTFVRFRYIVTSFPVHHTRLGSDGEVEDYEVEIGAYEPGRPGEWPGQPHISCSQPPIEIDPDVDAPPVFCGWDEPARSTELSGTKRQWHMDADDFRCLGPFPITRIRWWGGYKAWERPEPPDVQPELWHIGFWANQVEGLGPDELYLERLVWSVEVPNERVHREPVGLGEFPDWLPAMCYMCEVQLEPQEWFHQAEFPTNEGVFWISITAVYPPDVEAANLWGWKTRPHVWRDGAVTPTIMGEWPTGEERLFPGRIYPVEKGSLCGRSGPYDLCFELMTEDPWVKWDQPFTGIREWPDCSDDMSMALETDKGELLMLRQVADDWLCEFPDPVTAIAWNGSYIGYGYEACKCDDVPEPRQPDYFLLSILSNASGVDTDRDHSPGERIWEYAVYDYDEVLMGYDRNPEGEPNEAVFRYSVRLPEDAWFRQERPDSIYWLSVVAVFREPADEIPYSWGWTNHSHTFGSPALARDDSMSMILQWQPPLDSVAWPVDMSFTLSTVPEPQFPIGQVHYSKSTDDGSTFGPVAMIDRTSAEPAPRINPAIAVDGEGIIHVVWEDYSTDPALANIMYAKSRDDGRSFDPSVMVDDAVTVSTHQAKPQIAVDSNSIIHVVWGDYRRDSRLGDIYYAKSTDGGMTFGDDVCVDDLITVTSRQINPVITVDSGKIVHVAWEDYRDNAELGNIYYAKSTDGGQTFGTDIRVDDIFTDTTHQCNPAIAVDPLETVFIVWEDYRNAPYLGDIYCARSTDGGETFQENLMVEDPITITHRQIRPAVAVDGQGIVYVVWEDYRDNTESGNIYCSRSVDSGETFENDVMVDNAVTISTHQAHPAIATTEQGLVHIVWEDHRDHSEQANIYYSKSVDEGKTFGEDLIVSEPGPAISSRLNPAIAVDKLGVVHLVWQE